MSIDLSLLVRHTLCHPLPHLNKPSQSFKQVVGLTRGQPVLVQQFQHVVNDRVLSFHQQVRFWEGGFRNAGTGILAAEFGDDAGSVSTLERGLNRAQFHRPLCHQPFIAGSRV